MKRAVGVDVGTGNLCVAETNAEGKVEFYKEKDAFFKVNPASFMEGGALQFGEKMLEKSGANYIKVDGTIYILGDSAFKFANLFHKECLRPMAKGVLNPNEPISALMIKELVRGLAGEAKNDDDILYYCVPAQPIDAQFDIIYHANMLRQVFQELKYKNIFKMTEGLAVIYSELEDEQFSGIGISCGAGMINVCYAFLGVPVFSFSLARSGDWIDWSAAKAMNETANQVQLVKEQGMNINTPKGSIEGAIAIYYDNLISYIITKFRELYEKTDKKELPNINQAMSVVIAGGTSLVGGFKERFEERVKEGFPVQISSVKQAKDPLFAVVRGLHCAAAVSGEKTK